MKELCRPVAHKYKGDRPINLSIFLSFILQKENLLTPIKNPFQQTRQVLALWMCPGNTQAWRPVTSQGMSCLAPGWQVTLLRPLCLPQAQRMDEDAPAAFIPGDKISRLHRPLWEPSQRIFIYSFIFKQRHWKCHYLYLLICIDMNWATESSGKAVVLPPDVFILWEQADNIASGVQKHDLIISAHNIMKTGRRLFFFSILSHFSHSQWAVKDNEVIFLNLHTWKFIDNHREF